LITRIHDETFDARPPKIFIKEKKEVKNQGRFLKRATVITNFVKKISKYVWWREIYQNIFTASHSSNEYIIPSSP